MNSCHEEGVRERNRAGTEAADPAGSALLKEERGKEKKKKKTMGGESGIWGIGGSEIMFSRRFVPDIEEQNTPTPSMGTSTAIGQQSQLGDASSHHRCARACRVHLPRT
eukprot:gene2435-biopygen11464